MLRIREYLTIFEVNLFIVILSFQLDNDKFGFENNIEIGKKSLELHIIIYINRFLKNNYFIISLLMHVKIKH